MIYDVKFQYLNSNIQEIHKINADSKDDAKDFFISRYNNIEIVNIKKSKASMCSIDIRQNKNPIWHGDKYGG